MQVDDTIETPPADVGGDRDPNNNDTYESTDDNANTNVQV